ncbi:tudor domain-containing protein 15 isoform X1 [Octopus bimaculoides]|uniref:Tudor domain-containing protein 1 n=1 Tax=Octopus bimaculoides TaxID=37653 RepID=A0A0L8HGU2_OCTBM|nr:tudor domain-containing protein 15 isoform X1 [Octopus bimaculoides]|eukprot:XP_014772425.1 PREDICTED: tudor domain-containing protein 15-like isoform X1 [Octopus bimaculoides]
MSNSASFDVNEWNPLKEAYDNTEFNSYDCGPGKYLTMGERKPEFVDLFVRNLPRKFTEDGLRALFSKAGYVQRVKICPGKNGKPLYGFVTYAQLNEAEVAISKFNNLKIAGDEPLNVKLSFKDEKRVRDHQQKLQESAFFNNIHSRIESSNESDSEDNYSDSETRPCYSRSEKPSDKYAQHSIPSAYSPHEKQCFSRNNSSKNPQKTHFQQREKNVKNYGNLEVSNDTWKYRDSDEESTKPKSSPKKKFSKSPAKSLNNSQDRSGILQLKNKCVNCGSQATKRCSNCKVPYCSVRCQTKDWMNGHEKACYSFSKMTLQELADRFDVDLDLNTSGNQSKSKDNQSRQNNHQTRHNSSLSNQNLCDFPPKSDAVKQKPGKSSRKSFSKRESDVENAFSDLEIPDKWLGSVLSRTKSAHGNSKHEHTVAGNDDFEESYIGSTVSNGESNELETVELPSRGTCQVLVTYINELNIFVQLSTEKNQNIQKEIVCKLYESCKDDDSPVWNKRSLRIGQLYACVFSEDGVWYRAMLVEILKPNRVKVKYIDFGNCEITTIDKLRVLPPELKQVPQQAVCCVLNLPREATCKNSTKLAALIGKHILQDSQYQLKVVKDSTPPEVFIYDAEGNKINKDIVSSLDLNSTALPSGTTKTSSVSTPQIVKSSPVMACDVPLVSGNLKYGSKHKLRVIDVKSPEDFLVQFADEPSRAFCQFTKMLSSYAESCRPVSEIPFKGQLVLIKLETEEWTRAEVLDINNDSLLVSLIDFGTEKMIHLEHYRSAMPFCLDYPCLCIPSKLESVNFFGRNDDSFKMHHKFNQILKSLTKSEDFSKECILGLYMGCGKKCQWNLYDCNGETSVMDLLTSPLKVMASELKGCEVSIGEVLDGLAVEILNDSFYIIVVSEKQISFLAEFNTYLEKKDDHNGYTPCLNEMVAAKFSQDNQWYRGQIISNTADGRYKVFFVDYGNSEYVDKLQLQPFPVHFTPYPKQALHCYLPGVCGIKDNEKFSQLICNNVCKYKIEGCSKNVYEVVVYTSDGSCVNDCFEESLEKNAPNDYFPRSQSLNSTATSKSNSVKSASSLSISPFRSRSQSPQSIEGQPVDASSPVQMTYPPSCHRHHRDSTEHIFENQFSSEKKLPDDRQTKESIMLSLSTKASQREVCQEDTLQANRVKYFAKSMGCLQLKVNTQYELLCKWVVDTDCFYCQILDEVAMEALTDMTEQLNKMCETSHLNSVIQPEIGEVVCCKYSDGKWYRAKVMAVSKAEFSVFYVDFGCSGRVTQNEIMPLTDELAEIPILAARCSLAGKSKEKWTKEKLLQLREQPINAAVVGETLNSYSIILEEDFEDKKATNAASPSNESVSAKELILQQIEELKKKLESMD